MTRSTTELREKVVKRFLSSKYTPSGLWSFADQYSFQFCHRHTSVKHASRALFRNFGLAACIFLWVT